MGFEPTETHKTSTVFETVPFVHSGILPGGRLAAATTARIWQCFLKTFAQGADEFSVADANLFPDEAGFTPRPAWQVIEAARRQYLTGELMLPTNPITRIYLRDGMVYFAERTTDGTLPVRLMMEGVITRSQMQRGTVIVNGVEHVGRMFDADPTIDRPSVELCAELFTDDVMVNVANTIVDSYQMTLYRRHGSGIDRWYPHSVPVAGRPADAPAAAPATPPAPVATPAAAAATPAPQQPVAAAAQQAPHNTLNAPPITQAVPVIAKAAAVPPPPPTTQSVPVTPPPNPTAQVPVTPPVTSRRPAGPSVTEQLPVIPMPAPMQIAGTPTMQLPATTMQLPVTPSVATPPGAAASAAGGVDAGAIADEVAEAIKRAFAGMGAGQ